MIKLVIFDLDGVLVEARDIHYHAFNRALASIDGQYTISREEHLSTYDGPVSYTHLTLPTIYSV